MDCPYCGKEPAKNGYCADCGILWQVKGDFWETDKPYSITVKPYNPRTTILEKTMNPLEQLVIDNADEQNTRHGILTLEEVVAIGEAIIIGRKIDEMYATQYEH